MRINWNSIREVTLKAFTAHTQGIPATAINQAIYEQYRLSAARAPLSSEQQHLVDTTLSMGWQAVVQEAQDRNDQVLQIRDTGKHLAYSVPGAKRAVGHGEVAECVIHDKGNGGAHQARLQLIVVPQATGQFLNKQLYAIARNSACVSQWKVMNPALGSSGPDSAVLYLACPIDDGQVTTLVGAIRGDRIGAFLDANSRTPLGLASVAPGIFGCDLPDENYQRNTLGMSHPGSAGDIIARLIGRGTGLAAASLNGNDETSSMNSAAIGLLALSMGHAAAHEQYIKEAVGAAFAEVGWTLEN